MVRYKTEQLRLDGIDIEVSYKPIKSLRLGVKPTGAVRASVPERTTRKELLDFLRPRLDWVRTQRKRLVSLERPSTQLISGERHRLWGEQYLLEVIAGPPGVRVEAERIVLSVPAGATLAQRKQVLERWYRDEFRRVIEAVRPQLQTEVGREAAAVAVRWMKTRWGSCNLRTRQINLNLELVKRRQDFLQTTFIHELCHLITPGHGPLFQAQMDRCCPGWRLLRRELRYDPIGQSFWA
jgi:predicted metal-dependent hydrolase